MRSKWDPRIPFVSQASGPFPSPVSSRLEPVAEQKDQIGRLNLLDFLLEPLGGGMRVPLCLKFQPS